MCLYHQSHPPTTEIGLSLFSICFQPVKALISALLPSYPDNYLQMAVVQTILLRYIIKKQNVITLLDTLFPGVDYELEVRMSWQPTTTNLKCGNPTQQVNDRETGSTITIRNIPRKLTDVSLTGFSPCVPA